MGTKRAYAKRAYGSTCGPEGFPHCLLPLPVLMHHATGMRLPVLVAAGLAITLLAQSKVASAQNADPFFFGDEAALGAGAVVASGRDSGAFWYNPAGFGGLQRGTVSASASTFGLRVRKIPRALRVRIGGRETASDLSSSDVISVPNAIVAATKLTDRIAIAGGLLVTSRDVRSALVSVPESEHVAADGTPLALSQRLDMQSDTAKYHFGGALATALSNDLRLGAAVYGTYAKASRSVQYALFARSSGPNPTDERAFITQSARVTDTEVGVAASVGLQWQASSLVSLGLTIRSPEVALTASTEGGAIIAQASGGGTDPGTATLEEQLPPERAAGGKLVAPARALAGVAVALGPRESWLEIGVDATHGLPASSVVDALQPTVNGRIGLRYMLSPSWIIGGGLFTDRARERRLSEFISSDRVDYYGLTLGISKRTPLALVQDPAPEALVLVTTLSLRSSVGFGQARAVTLDLDQPDLPRDDRSDVTFFEVMPYLGSSVVF